MILKEMKGTTMKVVLTIALAATMLLVGCMAGDTGGEAAAPREIKLDYVHSDPMPVPEAKVVASEEDWEAKVHNKHVEIIQVVNILVPVKEYLIAAFEKYGTEFSETLNEDWLDTVHHLTKATEIWTDGQARMEAGAYDKKLFLDMEEAWQILVKTGVAGIRTKQMADAEMLKLTR